jgi:hypothetical protein
MQNRLVTRLAVLFLLLVLSALMVYWFLSNFEEETYTKRSEMSAQARRNSLLAAERLLDRLGLQVESRSGRSYLINPPEEIGLLLVKDLGAPLPETRVDALLEWVAAGGHLVVSPGLLQDEELSRPLQERFGVYYQRYSDFALDKEGGDEADDSSDEVSDLVSFSLPWAEERPLAVDFDQDSWFEVETDQEYWQAPDGDTPNLLIFPWGQGQVTFLSDNDFFSNERIGEHDHAVFLAELASGNQRAWLLYSAQMPSLLQLLWRWAPFLLVSLGLLIIGLLWFMSRTTGPRLCEGGTQRRDLLEHLQASAEFSWRIDPRQGSLEGARRQVEKRWLASHPHLQRLEQAARCQWLAERSGLTPEAVEASLYQSLSEGGQLIKSTINLQRLLAALHPQSKKR